MEIRFQADEDFNETIIAALKRHEPRIDFLTAFNAGIKGMSDLQVLEVAARLGRVLVTHDLKTMWKNFGDFIEGSVSPGLIVVSQNISVTVAAEELLLIWSASVAKEWVNRICTIPL